MPFQKLTILLLLISHVAFSRTPALIYSKDDLRVLYENRHHLEYIAHAKDIRPTERDQQWNQQVLEMSLLYIDDMIARRSFSEKTLNEIERLLSLAQNKKSEVFLFKRKDFIVQYLENCFATNKTFYCTKRAQDILDKTPLQRELSDIPTSMGLTVLNWNSVEVEKLVPFFKFGFISERSQFLCQKPAVREFIFHWFKNFNSTNRTAKEIKLFTADNFHPNCLEKVFNFYVAEYNNLVSPIDLEQIITWLRTVEYLSEEEINTLLAIYLLKGPVNGDVFNTAWNTMRGLGQNFNKRESILKKLKTLDPLPDNIFGLSDPLREKTLFSLISKNIPEYIDYYSQACIDYHTGAKTFPNGNPTIKCKEFYRLYKNKNGENHPRSKKLKESLTF